MFILSDCSIFKKAFSVGTDKMKRDVVNILYNENNKFILNKSLINLIEKSLPETDAFQAFIKEKWDANKISNAKSTESKTYDEQFIEIYNTSLLDFIIPLTLENKNLISLKTKLISISNAKKINKDWLVVELISKNICNVFYNDFKSDAEILTLFDFIYDIPKHIKKVTIFNRDRSNDFLKPLKGNHISLYTLLSRDDVPDLSGIYQDQKAILGGKLKMYTTRNNRIIHERKIIIGPILITIDNAFDNVTTKEPTWEILINNCNLKVGKWLEKTNEFREYKNNQRRVAYGHR